jgi:hypothetical protein
MAKKSTKKTVETLMHEADKRKNIPMAEFQSVVQEEQQGPIRATYDRRNRDLDPRIVEDLATEGDRLRLALGPDDVLAVPTGDESGSPPGP